MRKWWARSAIVWLGFVLAAGLNPGTGNADYGGGTIKIGVLNDQSGLYADIAGTASVWMARKAVEDFGASAKGMKVERQPHERVSHVPLTYRASQIRRADLVIRGIGPGDHKGGLQHVRLQLAQCAVTPC